MDNSAIDRGIAQCRKMYKVLEESDNIHDMMECSIFEIVSGVLKSMKSDSENKEPGEKYLCRGCEKGFSIKDIDNHRMRCAGKTDPILEVWNKWNGKDKWSGKDDEVYGKFNDEFVRGMWNAIKKYAEGSE